MSRLQPGAVIGILGGGQLGRMLSCAAAKLGYDVHVFTPEADSPASRVAARTTEAAYDDMAALSAFASACDVVTFEFENVPVESVKRLTEAGTIVRPGARSLERAQDRLMEKRFLRSLGIETVAFAPIDSYGDIEPGLKTFGGEALLKRRREGYDGKGQARVASGDDAETAWKALGEDLCVLEALAKFECEVSVVLARAADGSIAAYDVCENTHVNGILRATTVPANVEPQTADAALAAATTLAEALDHVGVLALEFFVLPGGKLLANEYAPRVHNSGHWTPEACETGQFEQHVRAVAGLPLGDPARLFDARMENLLGEEAAEAAGAPGVTLYGKREARAGRKMGHRVTRRAPSRQD